MTWANQALEPTETRVSVLERAALLSSMVSGLGGSVPRSMKGKPATLLLLLGLLLSLSHGFPAEPGIEYHHVWKLEAVYHQPIFDPDQWAADNFSDAPNAAKDCWRIERFELDIDHDGVPELFVTTPRLHGTGGGPHLVFQKRGRFYLYGGHLPGSKHTMRVLPADADGHPQIMTFSGAGGGRGAASVWKWEGRSFEEISSEVIRSGDSGTEEGRRRFAELFGRKGIEPDASREPPPRASVLDAQDHRTLDSQTAPGSSGGR